MTGKVFEKAVLKIIERRIEERCLLCAGQFDSRSRNSTTLQFMKLTDLIDFMNINISAVALILDIIKASGDT
jgi:hypothetical protein